MVAVMVKPVQPIDIGDISPQEFVREAVARGIFVFDLETTGLDCKVDRIEGIALYIPPINIVDEIGLLHNKEDGRARGTVRAGREIRAWFPFVDNTFRALVHDGDPDKKPWYQNLRQPMNQMEVMETLRPLFEEHTKVIAIAHNSKFDSAFMIHSPGTDRGFQFLNRLADSLLLDFLGDENEKVYGLKQRVKLLLGHEMTTYEDVQKYKRQIALPFMADKIKPLGAYAMEDTSWTYQLFETAYRRIMDEDASGTLERIYWNIDMPVSKIVEEMESAGVLIDWRWLRKVTSKLEEEKDVILDRIEARLGYQINPKSVPQVSNVLFGPKDQGFLGLSTKYVPFKEKGGNFATGSKEIGHLKRADLLVGDILDWRSKDMLQGSFSEKIADIVIADPEGRLHAKFNQSGTKIFRFSCVAAETVMETCYGPVAISELDLSDGRVYTIETHKGRQRQIVDKIFKGRDETYEVTLDGGQTIRCTGDHRFLTPSGWVKLKKLGAGSRLLVPAGVHQAGESDQEGARAGAVEGVLQGDLRRLRSDSDRGDEGVRRLVPGARDLPVLVQSGVRGGASAAVVEEAVEVHARQQARSRGQASRHQAQDQDAASRGQAQGTGVARPTGCADRGRDGDNGTPRQEERGALHDRPVPGTSTSASAHGPGAAGAPGVLGARLPGGVVSVLLEPGGFLPLPLPSVRGREVPAGGSPILLDVAQALCEDGQGTQGPRLLLDEHRGTHPVDGAAGREDSARSDVHVLQELADGLFISAEEGRGRGGWGVSRAGREDQGQGPAQGEEAHRDGLFTASVHDGRGDVRDGSVSGDHLVCARIVSVRPLGLMDVWDISVEEDHSYIAHGFVNHNSSNPVNFQAQPRKKKLIRKAFVGHLPEEIAEIKLITSPEERKRREDMLLMLFGADYSQIELRVAAHLSGDENMIAVYMSPVCVDDAGKPCPAYQVWACDECDKQGRKATKTFTPPDGVETKVCPACGSDAIEHKKQCRHVDIHTRTAEDVGVPRNPLAKCLDGRTLVRTVTGVRSLASLIPLTGVPGSHEQIQVTLADGRGGYVKSSSAIFRHNRPTKIVVTKRAVVIATEDHRFQVLGDFGSLDPATPGYEHVAGRSLVEAKNLEKGMKLPVAEMGEEGRNQDHAWHVRSTPQSVRLNPFTKEIGDGPAEIVLNEDWAYFAGMFHGDGCASGNACVITHGHTDEYEPWRKIVREACDKLGLPTTVTADKRNTRIGSRIVRRYFAALGLCEEVGKSGTKIMGVPWWVLDGGPKLIWSYLAGLFDTDGTVGKKTSGTASVTMKSPEYAGQIAFLLRELGMPVLVQPGFNKTYERWYYTIHVLGEGLERFQRYCPMRHPDKQVRLTERNETIKRRCAPSDDEVVLVLDGGERTVYDFQVENTDHLYLQGGLLGHNNLNFGCLYRIGGERFCQYADLYDANGDPRIEYSREVIRGWFSAYPGIRPFHLLTEESLKKNGWIAYTITGRRHRLKQSAMRNEYEAITQGIQFQVSGTAQDIIKIAMRNIVAERATKIANSRPAERALWKKYRFLIQVHDEVIGEGPYALRYEIKDLIERNMKGAARLRVPLESTAKFGQTWDDIH